MSRPGNAVGGNGANRTGTSRRDFLRTGLAIAGSLVLPLSASDVLYAADSGERFHEINDWVRIDPDGCTVIGLSQAEVGQGVYTGLPQVLADEMDADWRQVAVEFVTGRDAYRIAAANEAPQQFVGASMSVTMFYTRLRIAGAQARRRADARSISAGWRPTLRCARDAMRDAQRTRRASADWTHAQLRRTRGRRRPNRAESASAP